MKIVIVGNYDVGNAGDDAICQGAQELFRGIHKEVDFDVMGQGKLFPFGIRSCIKSLWRRGMWRTPFRIMKQADYVVLGGGGLFSDEESKKSSVFWALQGLMALWLKKPLMVLGISVGPMTIIGSLLTRYVLRRARIVATRDKQSAERLQDLGVTAYALCDLATFCSFKGVEADAKNRNSVLISLRSFKNLDAELCTIFAQLVDAITSDFKIKIILISLKKGVQSDTQILNKLFDQVKNKQNVSIFEYEDDLDQFMQIFQAARCTISMRLHGGIFSLMCGVPVLPLSYMSKSDAFWNQFKKNLSIRCDLATFHTLKDRLYTILNKQDFSDKESQKWLKVVELDKIELRKLVAKILTK